MKGFSNALIILAGLIVAAFLVGLLVTTKKPPPPPPPPPPPTLPTDDINLVPLPIPINLPGKPDPLSCGLHVSAPAQYGLVTSPATISGYTIAGPCWPSFEAQAGTVNLTDFAGNTLSGTIPVMLLGDWLTTNPVNFNLTLTFTDSDPSQESLGFLQFENSEGDVTTPRVFKLPVKF